jgi:hypothetical protein
LMEKLGKPNSRYRTRWRESTIENEGNMAFCHDSRYIRGNLHFLDGETRTDGKNCAPRAREMSFSQNAIFSPRPRVQPTRRDRSN